MKKSLIALAVAAGTIAAAQADTTTLYGSVGFSSTVTKSDDFKGAVEGIKENHWDIATTSLKLGVKGTEDLDNGLQAFFNIESNLDKKEVAKAYLGFKGDFGTLTIGRQNTVFKTATDNGVFEEVGVAQGSYPGTESKVISYVSPDASGIKFGAAVQADSQKANSKGPDYWEVAAMYDQNGFNAGLGYANDRGNREYLGLKLGYSNDQYNVLGNVRHASGTSTEFNLEGQYMSGKNTFSAGIGYFDAKSAKAKKGDMYTYALGYKYNFSERTYTWVEGQYDDVKAKGAEDGFKALVGVRHDF